MNAENRKIVIAAVKEAGQHLEGKLPPHPGLQKRNPWAHIYERIMNQYGCSYKELDDDELPGLLEVIKYYRDNPC